MDAVLFCESFVLVAMHYRMVIQTNHFPSLVTETQRFNFDDDFVCYKLNLKYILVIYQVDSDFYPLHNVLLLKLAFYFQI